MTGKDIADALVAAAIFMLVFDAGLVVRAHAADTPPPRQPHTACNADIAKLCPTQTGIYAILGCLETHRLELSNACAALLKENGK